VSLRLERKEYKRDKKGPNRQKGRTKTTRRRKVEPLLSFLSFFVLFVLSYAGITEKLKSFEELRHLFLEVLGESSGIRMDGTKKFGQSVEITLAILH
jgi:hypothetical protein